MRYTKLFAVALGGLLGAQVAPWTRWSWYSNQAGAPAGPPLPTSLLAWPGDTVWAIVDTSGMAAAGIVRWRWIGDVSDPSNDTVSKVLAGDYSTFSTGREYSIGLVVVYANGDSALSYKTAMLRRNWATLANYSTYNYACPGGEIWVLPDLVNTDIDSVRLYLGQGGLPLDSSPVLTRLSRWVFRAPTIPGTYELWGRTYLREGRTGNIPIFPLTTVTVAPAPSFNSSLLACVDVPRGICPNEPAVLTLVWSTEKAAPPSSPPQWDFNGDNTPDAIGWRVATAFPAPGTYPVTATVQVPGGCSLSFSGSVLVSGDTLSSPTVSFPLRFAVGYPVQARISGAKGLLSCDWEADGTWEVIGLPNTGGVLYTPPYTFSAPPPAGGYRLVIKQELCGQVRTDTFTWSPPTTVPVPSGGIALVPGTLLCSGDSLYVRLGALTNFLPGQPGNTVEWDFGGGFLPPTLRTDTAILWNGQPLPIRARLTNSAGGTAVLGPTTANRLAPWLLPNPTGSSYGLVRYRRAAPSTPHSWSLPNEEVFCPGDSIYFWLVGAPLGEGWTWRLLLPDDTVTLPASQARAGYTWRLPTTPGLYTIEHQLIGACGYTRREVYLFRLDAPTALHAGRMLLTPACGWHHTFGDQAFTSACAREPIPFFWRDANQYGRGGCQRVRFTLADGTPLSIISATSDYPQVLAPEQPGFYLVYMIWEGCAAPDTVRLWVEVRDKPAAFFTGPSGGCVGQPVTFQRATGLLSPGHPSGIQWYFEEPTAPDRAVVRYDTAATQTYTWTQPGRYRVTLTVMTPHCGTTSLERSLYIASGPPAVQITQATLQNGVLTFAGSASEADSVVWDFGDGTTLSGVLNGTHTYTGNGPYRVRLYAFNGCGSRMAEVTVTHLRSASPLPWRFYPNPASGQLWVEVPADDQGEVRLYSLLGQQIVRYAVQSGLNTLPLQGIPPGLYLLELRGRHLATYHRLMVE